MNQMSYPPNGAPMYQSPGMSGLQPLAPAQSAYTSTNKPPMQNLTGSFQVGTTAPVIAQPGQPIRFLDGTTDARPIPAGTYPYLNPQPPAHPLAPLFRDIAPASTSPPILLSSIY